MSRDEIPFKYVEILPKIKQYAEEHGLVIDFHFMKKIKWMETHGGYVSAHINPIEDALVIIYKRI